MLSGIIPKLRSELRARTIEGDFIDLEYTIADVIRGNIVIVEVRLYYRTDRVS